MHLADDTSVYVLLGDVGLMEKRFDHVCIRCLSRQTVGSYPGEDEKTMLLHEETMKR